MFGAHPLILLPNNGRYGTIRQYQEKKYPGKVVGTRMMFSPRSPAAPRFRQNGGGGQHHRGLSFGRALT